jgi:hypothetical protein
MTTPQIDKNATPIRTMITALIICDYSLRQIIGDTHQGLKLKVRNAMNSIKQVEQYFIQHPDCSEGNKQLFRKSFVGNELLMLVELLQTCYGINEEGLEEIINAIKSNITETNTCTI